MATAKIVRMKSADCPQCGKRFAFKATRPKMFCSPHCQKKHANDRNNARRTPVKMATDGKSPPAIFNASTPVRIHPGEPLDVEWLDCFPDLHRAVAGRLNRSRTTPREHAIGMDRAPIGHAVRVDGHWRGKVRSAGAVVWASGPFDTVEEAKRAVEAQLADRPELVAASLKLATASAKRSGPANDESAEPLPLAA